MGFEPRDADDANQTSQSLTQLAPTIVEEASASDPQPPSGTVRVLDVRRARRVAAVRIAFGLVWLVDTALKWTPHFFNGYLDHLAEGAAGKPGWLQPWFRFWQNLQSPAPRAWAFFVAGTETLLTFALLLGVARKLAYLGAAAFGLMIWTTAEGFGGPYTGRGADVDVGAGLIYVLLAISLLLLNADGPDPYSLDAVIERRLPWWRRLAELSPHRKARS